MAARQLARIGYRIIERGWRCRLGEIDLIALDGSTVVIVEVKTRRGVGYGQPAEAVCEAKQRRLCRLALAYLGNRHWLERACRFDVVEVLLMPSEPARLRHRVDAFRPPPVGRGARRRC